MSKQMKETYKGPDSEKAIDNNVRNWKNPVFVTN